MYEIHVSFVNEVVWWNLFHIHRQQVFRFGVSNRREHSRAEKGEKDQNIRENHEHDRPADAAVFICGWTRGNLHVLGLRFVGLAWLGSFFGSGALGKMDCDWKKWKWIWMNWKKHTEARQTSIPRNNNNNTNISPGSILQIPPKLFITLVLKPKFRWKPQNHRP